MRNFGVFFFRIIYSYMCARCFFSNKSADYKDRKKQTPSEFGLGLDGFRYLLGYWVDMLGLGRPTGVQAANFRPQLCSNVVGKWLLGRFERIKRHRLSSQKPYHTTPLRLVIVS